MPDNGIADVPKIQSDIADDYQTPPNVYVPVFGKPPGIATENDTNNSKGSDLTKYQEVSNLPTPIAPRLNEGVPVSTFSSSSWSPKPSLYSFKEEEEEGENDKETEIRPQIGNNHGISANSEARLPLNSEFLSCNRETDITSVGVKLNVPKTRKAPKQHKDEDRTKVRFTSEFKYVDPSSDQIDINKHRNLSISVPQVSYTEKSNQQNFSPVNRLVSVPTWITEKNSKPSTNDKVFLPENDSSANISVTYSVEDHSTQKWNKIEEIGQGSFSKVYLTEGGKVVIKITDLRYVKEPEDIKLRMQNSLTRELDILKELHHPNIIHLIGTNVFPNSHSVERVTMALNYAIGGDLFSFVSTYKQRMSYQLIQILFHQIVDSIYYIHVKHNVCHRDIKLENILLLYKPEDLIDSNNLACFKVSPVLMLTDFGLSKQLSNDNELLTTRCGSEDYVSPELLLGLKYDGKQNDCWSLGVVFYTILEARLPFDPLPCQNDNVNKRRSSPSHRIAMISWGWYMLKGESTDSKWWPPKEITKMLLSKRNKRANIQTIWNHPWIKAYPNCHD